jgi:hypothetical protein
MSEAADHGRGQALGLLTQEEAVELKGSLRAFRDGLPPRQRDAFESILAAAADTEAGAGDTQGYLYGLPVTFSWLKELERRESLEEPKW